MTKTTTRERMSVMKTKHKKVGLTSLEIHWPNQRQQHHKQQRYSTTH